MLGIQYHPPPHSSVSLEIYGSLSSPQHMNTDWAVHFHRTTDACWGKPQGLNFLLLFYFRRRGWSIQHNNLTEKQKSQSVVSKSEEIPLLSCLVKVPQEGLIILQSYFLLFMAASVLYKYTVLQNPKQPDYFLVGYPVVQTLSAEMAILLKMSSWNHDLDTQDNPQALLNWGFDWSHNDQKRQTSPQTQ